MVKILKKLQTNTDGKKIFYDTMIKMSEKNNKESGKPNLTPDEIKKINDIPLDKILNSDEINKRTELKLTENSEKISLPKKKIVNETEIETIKKKLQIIANKLHDDKSVYIKPDSVVIIEISHFFKNKLINSFELDSLKSDEVDKFTIGSSGSNDLIDKTMDIISPDTINVMQTTAVEVSIAEDPEDPESKQGGFYQYNNEVDYNFYMTGSGFWSKFGKNLSGVASGILVFTRWLISLALRIFFNFLQLILCGALVIGAASMIFYFLAPIAKFVCVNIGFVKIIPNATKIKETGKDIVSGAQTIGNVVTTGAQTIGEGVATGAQTIGHVVTTGAVAIGEGVATGAVAIGEGVVRGTQALSEGVIQGSEVLSKGVVKGAEVLSKGITNATTTTTTTTDNGKPNLAHSIVKTTGKVLHTSYNVASGIANTIR